MTDGNPIVQRRRLRTALRQHREAVGFTQREAADALDWSLSKLVRIESGNQTVSVSDLQAALQLYRVTDADTEASLKAVARAARGRPWWHEHRDVVSIQFAEYLGHETDASSLVAFHPYLLPGLLHTEAYAAAVLSVLNAPERTKRIMGLKAKRQELLFANPDIKIEFIATEEALRRWIGGRETMRRQLQHVRDLGQRPNIAVRIVPFSAGVHPGLGGSFTVVRNEDANEQIVYLESMNGDQLVKDEPELLMCYEESIRELNGCGLSLEDSDALLKAQIDHLE